MDCIYISHITFILINNDSVTLYFAYFCDHELIFRILCRSTGINNANSELMPIPESRYSRLIFLSLNYYGEALDALHGIVSNSEYIIVNHHKLKLIANR